MTSNILVLLAISYFIPTAIAMTRKTSNVIMIFIMNILLGWTVIGWFVLMLWAAIGQTRDQKNFYKNSTKIVTS